jgi:hypothetical protein
MTGVPLENDGFTQPDGVSSGANLGSLPNDFFDHLIDRSLALIDPVNSLKPRLPSRFEPEAITGFIGSGDEASFEILIQEPSDFKVAHNLSSNGQNIQTVSRFSRPGGFMDGKAVDTILENHSTQPLDVSNLASLAGKRDDALEALKSLLPTQAVVGLTPDHASLKSRIEAEQFTGGTSLEGGTDISHLRNPAEVARQDLHHIPRDSTRGSSASPISMPSTSQPVGSEALPDLQSIHVSIGRVEIRFIEPAKMARKQPGIPTGSLALEEYLRGGGKR